MALRFASFRHINTIWLDCKMGAMNRPLRLTECSLPYICAINGYYGVFVAIHFAHDKWFVRCMLDILQNNNIVVCVASVVIRLEYI